MRLAREGAAVAVNYRHCASEAENVVALIYQQPGRPLAVQADVGDASQVQSMAERVTRELGAIDILINNAGVLAKGDLADFDYTQMEAMRRTASPDSVLSEYLAETVLTGLSDEFGRERPLNGNHRRAAKVVA